VPNNSTKALTFDALPKIYTFAPIKTAFINNYLLTMGKGDRKTKKGKIFRGSYGVTRKRKKKNAFTVTRNKSSAKKITAPVEDLAEIIITEEAKPKKASTKKTAEKKPATKKAASKKAPAKKTAKKAASDKSAKGSKSSKK